MRRPHIVAPTYEYNVFYLQYTLCIQVLCANSVIYTSIYVVYTIPYHIISYHSIKYIPQYDIVIGIGYIFFLFSTLHSFRSRLHISYILNIATRIGLCIGVCMHWQNVKCHSLAHTCMRSFAISAAVMHIIYAIIDDATHCKWGENSRHTHEREKKYMHRKMKREMTIYIIW